MKHGDDKTYSPHYHCELCGAKKGSAAELCIYHYADDSRFDYCYSCHPTLDAVVLKLVKELNAIPRED
jgi:hypothetical protein